MKMPTSQSNRNAEEQVCEDDAEHCNHEGDELRFSLLAHLYKDGRLR